MQKGTNSNNNEITANRTDNQKDVSNIRAKISVSRDADCQTEEFVTDIAPPLLLMQIVVTVV